MSDPIFTREETIALKELDHLQAIVGRFDSFFNLSKQICLGAFGYVLVQAHSEPSYIPYAFAVPLTFFLMEYLYRYAYWTWYILRIQEVRNFLLGSPAADFQLYVISPQTNDIEFRLSRSLQKYDVVFYGCILTLALGIWVHWAVAYVAGVVFLDIEVWISGARGRGLI